MFSKEEHSFECSSFYFAGVGVSLRKPVRGWIVTPFFSIIIVTYNSQKFLGENLYFLEAQKSRNFELIVVDNGSEETDYLTGLEKRCSFPVSTLLSEENLGFAGANNLGIKSVCEKSTHTIFLNPDAFLPENFLSLLEAIATNGDAPEVLTGKLLRYDIGDRKPTTIIDTAGIVRSWYGRWYDRGQGEEDCGQFDALNEVDAICGALLICKTSVVHEVVEKRGRFFDENLFMYKEDIEVSRLLITMGYPQSYIPELVAYHCRGWQSRTMMSRKAKQFSAKNDLTVALRYSWRSLPFAMVKLFYVFLLGR